MSEADRLILAATEARRLSPQELRHVLAHVAQVGFDPAPNVQARGLAGREWQGRILRGSDRITSAERHYLRHVVVLREWPDGTSLEDYLASIREVILDPRSGVFTSRFLRAGREPHWQFGVVRRSEAFRGPGGHDWILVDYRVGVGYWVTAYQLEQDLRGLRDPNRLERRWLRRPR